MRRIHSIRFLVFVRYIDSHICHKLYFTMAKTHFDQSNNKKMLDKTKTYAHNCAVHNGWICNTYYYIYYLLHRRGTYGEYQKSNILRFSLTINFSHHHFSGDRIHNSASRKHDVFVCLGIFWGRIDVKIIWKWKEKSILLYVLRSYDCGTLWNHQNEILLCKNSRGESFFFWQFDVKAQWIFAEKKNKKMKKEFFFLMKQFLWLSVAVAYHYFGSFLFPKTRKNVLFILLLDNKGGFQ